MLSDLPGPGGHEAAVQTVVAGEWRGRGLTTSVDAVGNLAGELGGEGPRLALVAHADEVALAVQSIDPGGQLRVIPANAEAPPGPALAGQRVWVEGNGGWHPGVVGATTGHLRPAELRGRVLGWDDVFVELGLPLPAVEVLGVRPGSPVVLAAPAARLGRLVTGKAMDDRAGLAILTRVAELVQGRPLAYRATLLSTVQEEIGLVGAFAAGAGYDLAVVVDIGPAGDIPTLSGWPVRLGGGPVLVARDAMVHYSVDLLGRLERTARSERLPLQRAAFNRYGSDGAALLRLGVPAALVAFPGRYTHTSFETVDEGDLEATAGLLAALITAGEP